MIYARLGRLGDSLDLIDQLLAMPSLMFVASLELDPRWVPLRDHPRFEAVLEKYRQAPESVDLRPANVRPLTSNNRQHWLRLNKGAQARQSG
jgi:hypothetical protein